MRRRVTVSLVLMTALAAIALAIPGSLALRASNHHAQSIELQKETAVAAFQLENTGTIADVAEHEFGVYDASGLLIQGSGPAVGDRVVRSALEGAPLLVRDNGETIDAVPVTKDRALRVSEDSWEGERNTLAAVTKFDAIALAIVLLSVVVAVLVSRRLTRPLDALVSSTEQLGIGDFTTQTPRSGLAEFDVVAVAIDRAATQLSMLMIRERKLTAHAAHQIIGPLSSLRVAVEVEMAAPGPDPDAVWQDLLRAIDRMHDVLTTLMTISREAPGPGTVTDPVDAAQRAAIRWAQPFQSVGRSVVVVTPTVDALLSASRPAVVDIALDVLLDNAIRHGRGTATITVAHRDGVPVIRVADQGELTADDHDLFHAEPAAGSTHGFGLGIVASLVEAENGRVQLLRRQPTTFELILPLLDASAASGDAELVSVGAAATGI